VYGPGADEILLRQKDGMGYTIFLLDRHGNVAFLVDHDGHVLENYTYDVFGQPTITITETGQKLSSTLYAHDFLFQGREYIAPLGIYDYRNRFYLPATGRFLQTDPTGFGAGDMNLFRYCGDDPVDLSDPLGLDADIEQYRDSDALNTYVHNVNKLPGWPSTFIYAGHGSQQPENLGQVKDGRYELNVMGKSPTIPTSQVLRSITQHPAFNSREQIFLAVCSAGAKGSTLARHIAAGTGKAVIAPDRMLWISKSGRYFAADPKLGAKGKVLGPDTSKMGNLLKFTPDGQSQVFHRYYSDASQRGDGALPSGSAASSQASSANNSSGPNAAQVDAAHQALGVPSLGAESVNFAPGRP
jgi:RHS repeat-associated protein